MLNVTKSSKPTQAPGLMADLRETLSYCWTMKPGDPYYHGICLMIGGIVGCLIFTLLKVFQ